jgi:hypothetical protein
MADLEGRYVRINPAWSTRLGWSESPFLGEPRNFANPREGRHGTMVAPSRHSTTTVAPIFTRP